MKTYKNEHSNSQALYSRMEQTYQRYKQSKLSRSAFCKGEGIKLAQFTYWCHRFRKEAILAPETPPRIIATQAPVSESLQAEAKQVEKSPVGSISTETIPAAGFSQLHLPVGLASEPPMPAPLILPAPLIVLELTGKGSVSFYTKVEADFIKALL